MTATIWSIITGSLMILASGLSLIMNICVLLISYKDGFLKSPQSSIYIFAFVNIAGDAFQMMITTVYLGPSSIAQDFLFARGKDSFGVNFMTYLFLAEWYQEMLIQPVIAIDRLITVVFLNYAQKITRKQKIFIACCIPLCGMLIAVISNYVIPCCRYMRTNVYNYTNNFLDMPLNTISSFTAILCYVIIYIYVKKQKRKIYSTTHRSIIKKRTKEARYAIQFFIITIFGIFAWVTFRIFPLFVPDNKLELYSITEFNLILHCSVNGIIFLTINTEFRQKFHKHIKSLRIIISK